MKAVLRNENCEDARVYSSCNSKSGVIRCLDCCSSSFCSDCDMIQHEGEPFHDREVILNGFFQAVSSNLTLDKEGNITEKGNITIFCKLGCYIITVYVLPLQLPLTILKSSTYSGTTDIS